MTVYWCDPYMNAALADGTDRLCAGTSTSDYNTVRNGTYANPFSLYDLFNRTSNSATLGTTSVALVANDEIRIKGKTINDMTYALGDYYSSADYNFDAVSGTAATNHAAWHAGTGDYANADDHWCVFSGTNIDAMFPTGVDKFPMILYTTGTTSATRLQDYYSSSDYTFLSESRILFGAARNAGFTTNGNPFCTLRVFKTGYMTAFTELANGDHYHAMGHNVTMKYSAGWVSETSQTDGISIANIYQSDEFEYVAIGQGSTGPHYDCGQLFINYGHDNTTLTGNTGNAISATNNNKGSYIRGWIEPRRLNVTHKFGAYYCSRYSTNGVFNDNGSVNMEIFLLMGGPRIQTDLTGNDIHINLGISYTPYLLQGDGATNQKVTLGSAYFGELSLDSLSVGFFQKVNRGQHTVEFMNGASYYMQNSSGVATSNSKYVNLHTNRTGNTDANHIYPNVLYGPGFSGHWLSGVTSGRAPSAVGSEIFQSTSVPFTNSINLTPTTLVTSKTLDGSDTFGMIPVKTIGVLECTSQNYKTTASTISSTALTLGTENSNFPTIFACETNDYDNKPVTLIPSRTSGIPALAYNETVSGSEALVIQGGTASGIYIYPIEVQVPSTFDPDGSAGVNELRVKLVLSKTSSATNNPSAYCYYRNNTSRQVTNPTFTGVSTNQSGATAHTVTLTNASSGLKINNSVFVYIQWIPNNTGVGDKLYVHDCYAEVY